MSKGEQAKKKREREERAREIGIQITRHREEMGWSQKTLASKAGVLLPQVGSWETGSVKPSESSLKNLAKAFDKPVEELTRHETSAHGFGFLEAVIAEAVSAGEPSPITREFTGIYNSEEEYEVAISGVVTMHLRKRTKSEVDDDLACHFFGLTQPEKVSFVLGNAHKSYSRSEVHPAHLQAMEPFRMLLEKKLFPGEIDNSTLSSHFIAMSNEAPIHRLLSQSMIVFGSPTSNFLSQMIMGYVEQEESTTSWNLVKSEASARLPFDFVLDEESIVSLCQPDQAYTFTQGGSKIPNWLVLDRTNDVPKIPLIKDNIVIEDYLVLSKLPNIFGDHESSILSIAGAHGLGTASTALLLGNEEFLRRLRRRTERYGYWQALIPIENAGSAAPYHAGRIDLKKVRVAEVKWTSSTASPDENRQKFIQMLKNSAGLKTIL